MLIYRISIRFKGETSKVDCLAHINNLIINAILKSLSLSTYKDAYAFCRDTHPFTPLYTLHFFAAIWNPYSPLSARRYPIYGD